MVDHPALHLPFPFPLIHVPLTKHLIFIQAHSTHVHAHTCMTHLGKNNRISTPHDPGENGHHHSYKATLHGLLGALNDSQ